jgi:hypothetical protein
VHLSRLHARPLTTPSAGEAEPVATARRSPLMPLALAAIAASLLAIAGTGVRATLSAIAQADTPPEISSGTLLLTLDDVGDGFSIDISDLAPGDTVDRFVDLENVGTLDSEELGFAVSASGDSVLVTDGAAPSTTRALTLAIDRCTVAWTVATSTCGGTVSSLLATQTLGAAILGGNNLLGLTLDSLDTVHLRIQFVLPDQDEVSTNGVLPTPTVQDAAVVITATFRVDQRDPTSTSS